ncbi:rhamnogalacturonan acetylesterase [Robertmurraya sp. P23]|uniref:rhamnogalacturonan acetylesterase n=1 Tax=Robertmurraya sp. P23 TaxID=3436931 RepID=UPI003D971C2E
MDGKITIYIAGDSTASSKLQEKRPESGWGEAFQTYFKDHVRVDNRAINGRSTKSFIREGHLENIKKSIKSGDYLLIQFGHNDQKIEDTERGTHPYRDYQENLHDFIDVAYSANAYPVLLTPVTRRYFNGDKIDPKSVGDYPEAMLHFAKKHHVPTLDIHKLTCEWMNSIGEEESISYFLHLSPGESENYPDGVQDNTHFNDKGARAVAHLIVETIKKSDLPLKHLLNH